MRIPLTLVYIYCMWDQWECVHNIIYYELKMRNLTLVYIYVRSREMCTQYYSRYRHILLCTL